MISSEELTKQLEDPSIDDIVIASDDSYNHPLYNHIIYRRSDDKYYMTRHEIVQRHEIVHHLIIMTDLLYYRNVDREINETTLYIVKPNCDELNITMYLHNIEKTITLPFPLIDYNMIRFVNYCTPKCIIALYEIYKNNYTYPPIEEWKNAQWSGLK